MNEFKRYRLIETHRAFDDALNESVQTYAPVLQESVEQLSEAVQNWNRFVLQEELTPDEITKIFTSLSDTRGATDPGMKFKAGVAADAMGVKAKELQRQASAMMDRAKTATGATKEKMIAKAKELQATAKEAGANVMDKGKQLAGTAKEQFNKIKSSMDSAVSKAKGMIPDEIAQKLQQGGQAAQEATEFVGQKVDSAVSTAKSALSKSPAGQKIVGVVDQIGTYAKENPMKAAIALAAISALTGAAIGTAGMGAAGGGVVSFVSRVAMNMVKGEDAASAAKKAAKSGILGAATGGLGGALADYLGGLFGDVDAGDVAGDVAGEVGAESANQAMQSGMQGDFSGEFYDKLKDNLGNEKSVWSAIEATYEDMGEEMPGASDEQRKIRGMFDMIASKNNISPSKEGWLDALSGADSGEETGTPDGADPGPNSDAVAKSDPEADAAKTAQDAVDAEQEVAPTGTGADEAIQAGLSGDLSGEFFQAMQGNMSERTSPWSAIEQTYNELGLEMPESSDEKRKIRGMFDMIAKKNGFTSSAHNWMDALGGGSANESTEFSRMLSLAGVSSVSPVATKLSESVVPQQRTRNSELDRIRELAGLPPLNEGPKMDALKGGMKKAFQGGKDLAQSGSQKWSGKKAMTVAQLQAKWEEAGSPYDEQEFMTFLKGIGVTDKEIRTAMSAVPGSDTQLDPKSQERLEKIVALVSKLDIKDDIQSYLATQDIETTESLIYEEIDFPGNALDDRTVLKVFQSLEKQLPNLKQAGQEEPEAEEPAAEEPASNDYTQKGATNVAPTNVSMNGQQVTASESVKIINKLVERQLLGRMRK